MFVSANFIAIERHAIVEWEEVQDKLQRIITYYLNKNGTLFTDTKIKKNIQVYAESTPNPSVIKFVTNTLFTSKLIEIHSVKEATEVPLALNLFGFSYVKEVFISENYVSITKIEEVEWFEIVTEIRTFLKEYIEKGKSIISDNYTPAPLSCEPNTLEPISHENLDDISKEIVAILEEHIKPAVSSDGGNIQFLSYNPKTKIVNVVLQGACSGCPSATITLKNGIEATLKQLLPNKVETVLAING